MDSQPGILSLRFWLFGIFLINLFCLLMRFVRCRKRAEQGRVSDFRYFFLVNLILFLCEREQRVLDPREIEYIKAWVGGGAPQPSALGVGQSDPS